MNVTCQSCETVYRVDPEKVPEGGVTARCTVCNAAISLSSDGSVPVAPVEAPAAPVVEPEPTAAADAADVEPPRMSRPFVAPDTEPAAGEATPPRPSAPVFRPTPDAPVQPATEPPAPEPETEPEESAAPPPAAKEVPMTTAGPTIPMPAVKVPEPDAPEPPAEEPPAAATPEPVAEPEPVETPVSSPEPPAAKPVNPFLQRDPATKARRLARALISDMIVYQPKKREEALSQGTLKQDFDEEIKKSWEEYVEQVGEEMANSTTYFKEALNEILAGGQEVF